MRPARCFWSVSACPFRQHVEGGRPFATEPQWPRIVLAVYERVTRTSSLNSARRPRGYGCCRPRHYPAAPASDTGGVPASTVSARTCLAQLVVENPRASRPNDSLAGTHRIASSAYYSVISTGDSPIGALGRLMARDPL